MDTPKLAGLVALITGSSRGIGAGIARAFAAHGAKVAVHGRDRDATAAVCSELGPPAIAVTGDVSRADELATMRADIERQLGPVVAEHPLARLGTPDDVARAAVFLASDEAAWITGIVLDVAGGAVMPR